MEHRYADDSEPRGYTGRRYATDPDSSEYRVPEQRDPAPPEPEVRIPVRGPEYPTVRPPAVETESKGVYRTRRSLSSIILAAAVALLLVPVLRLLATVTFAADATPRGIVPAVLLTLGLALTGFGLFAASGGTISRDSWLRAPVAYLPAGLVLLLAAGLAVA
ncbi:hypothetical protein AB0F81_10065 [Actinoplanes sp. NPDC024001]|uniref:hypothetical protein n=1 Tax=Actinoplanes sp. NPDC024001 TaxID=3154598 RepID=UPI0033CE2F26